MVRGRADDEMSLDDSEWEAAGKSPEFERIKLINQQYKRGFRKIEDYLATLPPERASRWRKVLAVPLPKKPRRVRKPKVEKPPEEG
jgi:hypothetical protein